MSSTHPKHELGSFSTYEELAELLDTRLGEAEKARTVIDQMVKSGTNSHEAWLARARFDQRRGKIESAESDAIHALQLDVHRGRYDLAEQRLRQAIQGGSEDLQPGWRLAEKLIAQSKLDEAHPETARLRKLKLAKPMEKHLAARIAMVEGHWLDAIRKFESVRHSAASVPTLLPQIRLCLRSCYENPACAVRIGMSGKHVTVPSPERHSSNGTQCV